jgi:hypothetical protein
MTDFMDDRAWSFLSPAKINLLSMHNRHFVNGNKICICYEDDVWRFDFLGGRKMVVPIL